MHNEIPSCEVITAIKDGDFEDYLAELLFSQGWPIAYRGIQFSGVLDFLGLNPGVGRRVILYSANFPGLDRSEIARTHSNELIWICMDGVAMNSHLIMVHLRNQVREPIVAPAIAVTPKQGRRITITGTPGAPGRSSFALSLAHIAAEAMPSHSVELLDADLNAPALSFYFQERAHPANLSLQVIDRTLKPHEINYQSEFSITDTHSLISLRDVMTDRRWQGSLLNSLIEQSDELIYLIGINPISLHNLEAFIRDTAILTNNLKISYVLNQVGNSRLDRAMVERFNAITEDRQSFTLPKSPALGYERGKKEAREIATIATHLQLVEGQPWARSTTSSRLKLP